MKIRMIIAVREGAVFSDAKIIDAKYGKFEVELNTDMLKEHGLHLAQIEIFQGDDCIQTPLFRINISKSIKSGAISGSNFYIDFNKIKEFIEQIEEWKSDPDKLKGDKGEVGPIDPKGNPFRYEDFTEEQLEKLRGPRGVTGPPGIQGPKGDSFKYEDFTDEQLEKLKGPKGEQGMKGEVGDVGPKGNPGKDGTSILIKRRFKYRYRDSNLCN